MKWRAACFLAAFAAASSWQPAGAEEGVTQDKVTLGATNAATGPVAAVCSAAASGTRSYLEKINKSGGIADREIEYSVLDDGYSPQRAIGNIRRLTQRDKVFAVLGGCGTATAASALSVLEKTDVPYLFPYAGLDRLAEPPKKNVFALLPQYPVQLSVILPYVLKTTQPKSAAIFTFNIAGHEAVNATVKGILEKAGVKVVDEELMDVTSPDRSVFALKANELKPDLIVLNDSAPGAAKFLLELKRQHWMPKAVTGVSTLTDESFLKAVGDAVDDVLYAPGIVLPPNADTAKECNDALKAADASLSPSHFTMYGCLAAKVAAAALEKAGKDLTHEKLIEALDGMKDFDSGISGKITFADDKRMGLDSLYAITVKGGEFQVGESLPIGE